MREFDDIDKEIGDINGTLEQFRHEITGIAQDADRGLMGKIRGSDHRRGNAPKEEKDLFESIIDGLPFLGD